MSSIKNKFILSTVLIFSIFALITAYFIQYILGHEPCNLCLIERIPYFTAVALISLIVGLFFIFGAIISFYHFGIEQGFFKESLVCDLGDNKAVSAKDLLKQLEKEIISCKDVSFKILGLSLATFNTIISTIISVIMLKIVIIYDKN